MCTAAKSGMFWKFLTFCILVCIVIFVVLSSINGRPVTYLLFTRCCEEGIENDQFIVEYLHNNVVMERLVISDFTEDAKKNNSEILIDEKITVNVHNNDIRRKIDINYKVESNNETKSNDTKQRDPVTSLVVVDEKRRVRLNNFTTDVEEFGSEFDDEEEKESLTEAGESDEQNDMQGGGDFGVKDLSEINDMTKGSEDEGNFLVKSHNKHVTIET